MLIAHTIHTDGSVTIRVLNQPMSLRDKQGVVGGLIQIVPDFGRYADKPCIAFCNEEGLLEGLAFNPVATAAWRKFLDATAGPDGYVKDMANLVGDVLVITGDTYKEVERGA